jgi:predicted DNA-binding transcriptional regulator AlpA
MNPYLYDRVDLRRRGIKLSNSTLLRLEARAAFPARLRIGRTVYWSAREIDEYVDQLGQSRGGEE